MTNDDGNQFFFGSEIVFNLISSLTFYFNSPTRNNLIAACSLFVIIIILLIIALFKDYLRDEEERIKISLDRVSVDLQDQHLDDVSDTPFSVFCPCLSTKGKKKDRD